jgi:Asp-tRNA(Asn)/Glu-tRNA(Gln) amidotransferase A subunit family amidase
MRVSPDIMPVGEPLEDDLSRPGGRSAGAAVRQPRLPLSLKGKGSAAGRSASVLVVDRSGLAAAVRDGDISPVDLVEEALRRIEAHNPAINAVVALRAEAALDEARRHPRTGPLAGLPVLVKDLAHTVGLPTTSGSPWFAGSPPDREDDLVVARLKAAGAIVVGKSNSPAFGHTAFTTNALFGPTRNPWNLERSPGGSSGGSAAALAAGLVPLATTSDGGGSVRIPASLCGLVGYKPTNGALGRGTLPRWLEFSTMGATGTSVADVLTEAEACLGPAPGDVISIPRSGVDLELAAPARLFACRSLRGPVEAGIEAVFERACEALGSDLDVPVEPVGSPTGAGTVADWFTMACAELAQSLADLADRWEEAEPTLAGMLRFGSSVPAFDYIAAARRRWDACRRVDDLLGADGVLLTPTVNAWSWPPEGPLPAVVGGVEDPGAALNTPDFNFTGHPAVSVPLGLDPTGVPFGLQVVAPRCRDGLALAVAGAWERISPWPRTAPGYPEFGV